MKEYASNPATRTGGNGDVILLFVARITYKCLLLVVARCIIYMYIYYWWLQQIRHRALI